MAKKKEITFLSSAAVKRSDFASSTLNEGEGKGVCKIRSDQCEVGPWAL